MAESKDRYKYFRIESRELLEGLSQGMLELERGGPGKDLIGRILRLAHTLKGASRVVKQTEIAGLAQKSSSKPYAWKSQRPTNSWMACRRPLCNSPRFGGKVDHSSAHGSWPEACANALRYGQALTGEKCGPHPLP